MCNSDTTMTAYYIEQQYMLNYNHTNMMKQEEQQVFTSFDEQDLLLTTGFYPSFTTTTYTNNYPMSLSSSDEYSTISTNSSCSPDMMTYQYGYDQSNADMSYFPSLTTLSSPIESTIQHFDFYPFIEDNDTSNKWPTTLDYIEDKNKKEENSCYYHQYNNNTPLSPTSLDTLSSSSSSSINKLTSHNTTTDNNNKPYPCHLCKRAFARKHDLQRHIRVHTGDKPYVCPCCKKAFARTDALKRHIRMEDQCRSSQEVLLFTTMKGTGRRKFIKKSF